MSKAGQSAALPPSRCHCSIYCILLIPFDSVIILNIVLTKILSLAKVNEELCIPTWSYNKKPHYSPLATSWFDPQTQ